MLLLSIIGGDKENEDLNLRNSFLTEKEIFLNNVSLELEDDSF